MGERIRKKKEKGFKDISHYFLSAAEADVTGSAARAAGHQAQQDPPGLSSDEEQSPPNSRQPMRRKENCASCAHLIARSGQPFQCRVYSLEHSRFKVPAQESIELQQGRTCAYFIRVSSRQIEDILRSHGSALNANQIRELPHEVEEKIAYEKMITIEAHGGMTAEEAIREELLRYLVDGYSVIDATIVLNEDSSNERRRKQKTTKVHLRVRQNPI